MFDSVERNISSQILVHPASTNEPTVASKKLLHEMLVMKNLQYPLLRCTSPVARSRYFSPDVLYIKGNNLKTASEPKGNKQSDLDRSVI